MEANKDAVFIEQIKNIIDTYEKKAHENPKETLAGSMFYSLVHELKAVQTSVYGEILVTNISPSLGSKICKALMLAFADGGIWFSLEDDDEGTDVVANGSKLSDPEFMDRVRQTTTALRSMID